MADWLENKGAGPWPFTERGDVFGYLNNPRWSSQQDAIDFCEANGLPLDLPNQHLPCSHWHKEYVIEPSRESIVTGKWVAAMSQPGTPYIYLYDVVYEAVIKLDTSVNPIILAEVLSLDSAYALDYDMGRGNPGAQRGGYCMNKDGTRIWYLFCDQKLHYITRDHPDAQLVEVDISHSTMRIVKKTLFPNLLPADSFPGPNEGRVSDGCSNDTYTYWCTQLVAGRIIKIRNSDHSIVDDHTFNFPDASKPINTLDVDKGNSKLYWSYCINKAGFNACSRLIRSNLSFSIDVDIETCGNGLSTPWWQNMIRIYSGFVLHHRAYHPSSGYFGRRSKTDLSLIPPTRIAQQYLQNIFGVKGGKLFTLMLVNSVARPAYLYCIDFSNMTEISKLDISYYAGQGYLKPYDWHWTSVSAMNEQTGTIIIVRYHDMELKNYVACFEADSSLDLICDERMDYVITKESGNKEMISDEPQVWQMPG